MKKHVFLAFAVFFLLFPNSLFAASGIDAAGPLEKGIAQLKAENYEEALELLKEARRLRPDSSIAAFYLGLDYKQMGDYREAAANYRDALRLTPPVTDAYTELIEVLYNLDELKEAKEWIGKAEKEGVKPAYVAFLKGLVSVKEDKPDDAIAAFGKAKELDKSLTQSADLQIAMAYAKERMIDKARQSLKSAIAVNPTSEIASFARDYENAFAKSLAQYRKWRFAAGIAYQYDDNVISKPLAFISPNYEESVKEGGGKGDSAVVNTARIEYTPMLSGPWLFDAQYDFNAVTYRTITPLNVLSNSVTLTPGYNFRKGTITLPVGYNYAWVGSERYLWLASARPTASFILAPRHIGQISAGYARREMLRPSDPDEDRDADLYTLSAGYIYQFPKNKGLLNLRYEYTKENTEGRNWRNDGHRFGAAVLVPIRNKVSLTVSGDVFLQQYRDINTFSGAGLSGFPAAPEKRRDKTYSGAANIAWEILRGLTLNFQYSHTRDDSNFAVYDYQRNQYTAGIEYDF